MYCCRHSGCFFERTTDEPERVKEYVMIILLMFLLVFAIKIPLFFVSAWIISAQGVSVVENIEMVDGMSNVLQIGIGIVWVSIYLCCRIWRLKRFDTYKKLSPTKQFLKVYRVASVVVYSPLFMIVPVTDLERLTRLSPLLIYECLVHLGVVFAIFYYGRKRSILNQMTLFKRENSSERVLIIKQCWTSQFPRQLWRHMWHHLLTKPKLERDENYLVVPDYVAWFYRKQLEKQTYYYLTNVDMWKKSCKKKKPVMSEYFIKNSIKVLMMNSSYCELSFFDSGAENKALSIPKERLHFLLGENWQLSSVIHEIEKNVIGSEEKLKLYEIANTYEGADQGKKNYCQMVKEISFGSSSDNEYFYALMKAVEFMFHYQALADYEVNNSRFFDFENREQNHAKIEKKPDVQVRNASLGIYKDSIANKEPCDYCKNHNEYRKAIKELIQMGAIRDPGFKNRPVQRGREAVIMLRNNIIGHGSTAYSISPDVVRNLTNVVIGLTCQFLFESEPMMVSERLSNNVVKIQIRPDGLYLLSGIIYERKAEDGVETVLSTEYMNYLNGEKITCGEMNFLVLNKKV